MLQTFTAQNYGCLRDVTLRLTPLHAIVGPNDSGKSTLLKAIELLTRWDKTGQIDGDERFPQESPLTLLNAGYVDKNSAQLCRSLSVVDAEWRSEEKCPFPALIRWEADALRKASHLLPDGQQIRFISSRGEGLPGIYDAILSRGDDAFFKISERLAGHFRSVKRLRLKTISVNQKVIEVELKDGRRVEAKHMSEGMLYYLAFEALRHVEGVGLLLIEEPENGLHPARISEVMGMLRGMSEQGTQILLSTHSPLVLNEMKADEVTVLWRTENEGTQAMRMCDTPHFQERSQVLSLGELWLNYCNGVDEAPLVRGIEEEDADHDKKTDPLSAQAAQPGRS